MTQSYDIIGDIHGHAAPLEALLKKMGYREDERGVYAHPEGRKALFLGDYIDRGPQIARTLEIVRAMQAAGEALCIMGNHEYNAICYHTTGQDGKPLRAHTEKNVHQHAATMEQFAGRMDKWADYLEWFKTLPLYLELDGIRAVHATWRSGDVELTRGKLLTDREFLLASEDRSTEQFAAVDCLLKGIEIKLPDGLINEDKEGFKRDKLRVKWWLKPDGPIAYRDLAFPESNLPEEYIAAPEQLAPMEGYGEQEPPVFFGHYWLSEKWNQPMQTPNVCCLDFSVAKGGSLCAYRWDGESHLTPDKIIRVNTEKPGDGDKYH